MEVSMIYLEQTPKTSSKKSSINSPKKSPNKISGEETKESDHKKINPQKTKNQILKEEPFFLEEDFIIKTFVDRDFTFPELHLREIQPGNRIREYIIKKKEIQLHRKTEDFKSAILIDDLHVSKKHAQILLIKHYGYFIRDLGSFAHTYIKIVENQPIVLEIDMQIKMGNSVFKVMEMQLNQITFQVFIEDKVESLEIRFNHQWDDIYFGKKTSKNPKIEFTQDQKIEDEQAIFKRIHGNGKLVLVALPSALG